MPRSVWFLGALLGGCTVLSPFDDAVFRSIDSGLTAMAVAADPEHKTGANVLWGGVVGEVRVLEKDIELGVLGFPLESHGEPLIGEALQGRFVARYGYGANSVHYVPGQRITIYGRVLGVREVPVGATRLSVPVIEPLQTHLWDEPWDPSRGPTRWPSIHFGFGIMGGF